MPVSTDQSSKLGLLKKNTIPVYYVSPRLVDLAAVGFEELEKKKQFYRGLEPPKRWQQPLIETVNHQAWAYE